MNLLLVGAGQLGSRHLQSCLKYEKPLNIYVVDNSETALTLSKERAEEIENKQKHEVKYLTSIKSLAVPSIDYLIIATGASVRYQILFDVLQLFSVKYAILEKVLFQDLQSLTDAAALLTEYNVIAFVNCPLRAYPFFKEIKNKYISKNNKTELKYVGGEWIGLACNLIHYLDLINFLSDENIISISTSRLDDGYINSKRPGNIEFTGVIDALFEFGASLSLEAIKGSKQDSIIEIINGCYKILIDELSGKYKVFENDALLEDGNYEILYQSNLSHRMIQQIEETGICDLIEFDKSAKLHRELITKLLAHYNNHSMQASMILPIT